MSDAAPWSALLSLDSIIVKRDERQRKELTNIEELMESIKRRGQLQPVVISRDNVLIAGERRYTALQRLNHSRIKVVYSDELDEAELKAIELEENIKRVDLPWKDNCLAIDSYHRLHLTRDPDWTQSKTAEALGLDAGEISSRLAVAEELQRGNKLVAESPKLSTAKGIVKRQNERRAAAETSQLMAMVNPKPKKEQPNGSSQETSLTSSGGESAATGTGFILNEDFNTWAESFDGERFNLIHCDFPYGVGMHKSDQGSGDSYGTYEDTPDIYWALVDTLLAHLDNFCEDSAHLIFWFSMDYYTETLERLGTRFSVNPFPLVWHKSDGAGILPDPNRGPRRTYETALFASRGDRKIVRAVSNSVGAGITRGRHMSEKSQDVLRHFFRMVVDEHTSLLDPTCGSGSALRAAHSVGAPRFLGLEVNKEFADHADELLTAELEKDQPKLV